MPPGLTNTSGRSGLPPIDSLTLQPNNPVNIPRLHHHSSDESDSGFRSGGHGGAQPTGLHPAHFGTRPAHHRSIQLETHPDFLNNTDHFDDTPFVPHRPPHSLQPALPPQGAPLDQASLLSYAHPQVTPSRTYDPDGRHTSPDGSHRSSESYRSSSSSSSGNSAHSGFGFHPGSDQFQSHHQPQFSHANPTHHPQAILQIQTQQQQQQQQSYSAHYPAYHGPHRVGLEHTRFSGQPGPGGAGPYYRTQAHVYPADNTVASEGYHNVSPEQQLHGLPHMPQTASSQRSSSSSASSTPQFTPGSGPNATYSISPSALTAPASVSYPDAGPYLRQQLGLAAHQDVNLYSLPDPPQGEKPNQPYPTLIKLAIYGSPRKQLTLQEIYQALEARFEWFRARKNDKAWKNSIRHNLSLNKVFRHAPRPITEPGKGSYWQLDVSEGEGYKRTRKRRSKSARANQAIEEDDNEMSELDEETEYAADPSGSITELNRSPSFTADDNIDPELRREGHIVGEGRSKASGRRAGANSPYPSLAPSQPPRYGQLPPITDPRYSQPELHPTISCRDLPNQGGRLRPPMPVEPATQGQPARFGQPSFGQPSFGHPGFNQMPVRGSSAPSTAFMASASETVNLGPVAAASSRSAPRPAMAHDRHAPIVQPTPRPGIEYIRDEGGLPSARRIPVQHGLPSPTHQVDSPQGSSYSEASPIDEWQNPQYYSSRSGGAQDRGRGRI